MSLRGPPFKVNPEWWAFLFIGYVSLSSEEFDGLILLFGGVWNAHKKKIYKIFKNRVVFLASMLR